MSSRRTLILVGAVVVGALAALLILRYVSSVEDTAATNSQLVPVVIVASDVKQGEQSDGLIEAKKVDIGQRRRIDLPANAVTRLDDIRGQVAAIDLPAGQIVTTSMFAGSTGNASSKSNVVDKGMVALTMSVDQAKAVAGLIEPGDYVNVMAGLKAVAADGTTSGDFVGSTTLFQKVKVLAIGKNLGAPVAADPNNPAAATATTEASNLVTVEVPAESAGLFAWIGATGTAPYLVLVRPDYQPHPLPAWVAPKDGNFPGTQGKTPYDGAPLGSETAQVAGQ